MLKAAIASYRKPVKKPEEAVTYPDKETNKGDSLTPGRSGGDQTEGTGEKENKGTQPTTPAEIRAWQSFCWVIKEKPELVPIEAGKDYSDEMHEAAISESGLYQDPEGVTIAQPKFDSWKRNIRGYKSKSPTPPDSEDKPREDFRHGEVDSLSEITSKYEHRAD